MTERSLVPQELTPESVLGQKERFLIYGEPGTGKTFLALTAPEPIYVIVVGSPNELKTRYSKEFLARYPKKKIYFTSVQETRDPDGSVSDNPMGLDEVGQAFDHFLEWNEQSGAGVRTLVIDNATELIEYQLNKAIYAEYQMASVKTKTALKREREFGIRKPHDSTWGGAQSLMDKFLNYIKELPFHIVLVAHEWQDWSQKEGTRERQLVGVKPIFVGKQRTNAPRIFDNVWRTSVSGGGQGQTFNVQTVGTDVILAKTRVGGILSPFERDLDLTDVINQFMEYPKELE